ncbi:MAG: DUF2157 domain-containing protein [Chitinophagales bacterium]|nr:DUF2157 domain-containing protein [Chitinophagales bacterium]MCZ2392331.1 DUF2157 domain-containing protein [Chitinophagales bacterium]
MSIEKDIKELLEQGIITEDVAKNIDSYYKSRSNKYSNLLFVIFSIIGAVLVGLGVVLLVAHNWDEMSRLVQTLIAFGIVIIGQIFSIYGYLKKKVWTEAAIAFLVISIGTCIALIGQIYNVLGNENQFIFIWMILVMPMMFLLKSKVAGVSTLLLSVIFCYVTSNENSDQVVYSLLFFWPVYLGVIWFYLEECKSNAGSFFNKGFIYLLLFALISVLAQFAEKSGRLLYLSYFLLFQLFFTLSNYSFVVQRIKYTFSLKWIGILGMNLILGVLIFDGDVFQEGVSFYNFIKDSAIHIAAIILLFIILTLLNQSKSSYKLQFFNYLFIFFTPFFLLDYFSKSGYLSMTILISMISLFTIYKGIKNYQFSITNIGLFLISLILLYWFLNKDYSFISRGLVFIFVGIIFFLCNLFIFKNNKIDEA